MTNEERGAIMDEARRNIERLADRKPRTVDAGDDALRRWQRMQPEPEPPSRVSKLDTDVPGPVSAAIVAAIAAERAHLHELLIELIGEIQAEADSALAKLKEIGAAREAKLAGVVEQLHQLRIENANARADIAELRAAFASGERAGKVLDMPNPLSRRH
jgi:hypothetical protein